MSQQQKEDSVLFSLRSLMSIEDERVRREDEARRRSDEASRTAALDARRRFEAERLRTAEVAEAARAEAERAERAAEAQAARAREESALRIRLESESRLRERELTLRMEQEQKLALIAAQQRRGAHPGAVAAAVLALVGALGAGAFYGLVRPQQEASAAETQRAERGRRDADERRVVAERAADDARRHAAEAEADRQRQAAVALLARQEAERAATSGPRPVTGPSRVRSNRAAATTTSGRETEIIGAIGDELPGGE